MDFDRCQCIAAIDASNFAFVKVEQFIWSKSLYSQMQECSLNAYREDALSRKTKCKKAVGNCKTAAVTVLSKLQFSDQSVKGIRINLGGQCKSLKLTS